MSGTRVIPISKVVQSGGVVENRVRNEIPTGAVNGSNKVFTTQFNFVPGSTRPMLNGLEYAIGAGKDYVETSTSEITLDVSTVIPNIGDDWFIDYTKQ